MTEEVKFILSADDAKAAAALARTDAGLKKVAQSTALTKQQMQQLNFQLTDIVVGLSTGQSPFTVLLQQGGQLKDMFGGVGGASRAVAGQLSFLLSPVTAVAGAFAALGGVAFAGYQEQQQFARSLAITGNIAGQTADTFTNAAERIAAATNTTIGSARELLQGAVSNGGLGKQSIEEVTRAMAQVQRITGQTAEETLKQFSRMSNGVASWVAETNRQYNFLSPAQFAHIQRLEKEGKAQDAMREAGKALADTLGQRIPVALGTLDRVLQTVSNTWSKFWDAVKGIGKEVAPEERIAELQKAVENLSQPQKRGTIRPGRDEALANAQAELANALEIKRLQQRSAEAQGQRAADAQAAIKKLQDNANNKPKTFDELYPRANVGAIIGSASDASRLRQNEAGSADAVDKALRERNQAEYDAEKQRQDRLGRMQDEYAADWAERQAYLVELAKPEWQKLVDSWADVTAKMQEESKAFQDNFVDAGRNAFAEFLRTGKISMSSFTDLITQTIGRLIYDKLVAKQMAALGESIFSALSSSLFGAPTTPATVPGYASGGNFGGGLRIVGERGPELEATGPSRIWNAQQTRAMLAGGGGGVTVNQTLYVGQGVNFGQVAQAMGIAKQQAVAEIQRQKTRGNRVWD